MNEFRLYWKPPYYGVLSKRLKENSYFNCLYIFSLFSIILFAESNFKCFSEYAC